MNLEELSREELVAVVRSIVPGSDGSELEQLLHDLHVHQIEVELQNRQLLERHSALEASKSRYHELYELAPAAYCTLDCDGRVTDANLTFTAFFRMNRAALIGTSLSSLVLPDDRPVLRSHLKRCFSDSGRVTHELRMLASPAVRVACFQIASLALRSPDGVVLGTKSVLTDISALKRTEERLRVLAAASAAFASATDVTDALAALTLSLTPSFADLCFVDLFQDGCGTATRLAVASADLARRRLCERLREGVIPAVELTEPVLLSEASPAALALALPEGPDRLALVAECDARSIMLLPLLAGQRCLGLIGFVMSDTGRRYTSVDLIFARDLASRAATAIENARLLRESKAAIRARQDMLSIVSHELRTPLTGALLNAEALTRAAPSGERRKGRAKLEHIRRALQQMDYLVNDLLDVTSIEAGKLALARENLCVLGLIREAVELVEPLAHQKSVAVDVVEPARPLWVDCDGKRLLQVLCNLLANGIKFAPEGGVVTISARAEGTCVRVAVDDNGPGIAPAVLRRLFERFVQASDTARQGRGLGLYIAKGIVEAHGGRIWAETELGRGTRLQFTVAAADPPERTVRATPVILIVEDEDLQRELTCDVLVAAHLGAVPVANGREALEYLRLGGARPQLILLDLIMPVMSGRELAETLKADPELRAIPIVVVSCASNLESEAKALGAAGWLAKPFDVNGLLGLIRALGVEA